MSSGIIIPQCRTLPSRYERSLKEERPVRFCYCDESGTGSEPIATMAGIVVNAKRMHITKRDWIDALRQLEKTVNRRVPEFHTKDFYAGHSPWKNINKKLRAKVITVLLNWLVERKHSIVYSAVVKSDYKHMLNAGLISDDLNTEWRMLGLHLALAIQKSGMKLKGMKGNTVLIFDNKEKERMKFADLIHRPLAWCDQYYEREAKQDAFDQIVDVPYFVDSRFVGPIQIADLVAYILRRYAEFKEGHTSKLKLPDEKEHLEDWVEIIAGQSIGSRFIYPKKNTNNAHKLFYDLAPPCIRDLK